MLEDLPCPPLAAFPNKMLQGHPVRGKLRRLRALIANRMRLEFRLFRPEVSSKGNSTASIRDLPVPCCNEAKEAGVAPVPFSNSVECYRHRRSCTFLQDFTLSLCKKPDGHRNFGPEASLANYMKDLYTIFTTGIIIFHLLRISTHLTGRPSRR